MICPCKLLEHFKIDRLARLYGIQNTLLGCNSGARAEPESIYHFCLQEEGQLAQLSQGDDCLKREDCSCI
jgi:hypothetical protein